MHACRVGGVVQVRRGAAVVAAPGPFAAALAHRPQLEPRQIPAGQSLRPAALLAAAIRRKPLLLLLPTLPTGLPPSPDLLSSPSLPPSLPPLCQACEGLRPDVLHVSLQLLPYPWFRTRQAGLLLQDRGFVLPSLPPHVSTNRHQVSTTPTPTTTTLLASLCCC